MAFRFDERLVDSYDKRRQNVFFFMNLPTYLPTYAATYLSIQLTSPIHLYLLVNLLAQFLSVHQGR